MTLFIAILLIVGFEFSGWWIAFAIVVWGIHILANY